MLSSDEEYENLIASHQREADQAEEALATAIYPSDQKALNERRAAFLSSIAQLKEERERAQKRDNRKASEEAAEHWFRRFMTSLQIVHGAAFLAMASGILQADDFSKLPKQTANPFALYGTGLILAGLIPFFLYAEHTRRPRFYPDINDQHAWWLQSFRWGQAWRLTAFWFAILSAVCFLAATQASVDLVRHLSLPEVHSRAEVKESLPSKAVLKGPTTPPIQAVPTSPKREQALPSSGQPSQVRHQSERAGQDH